MNDVEIVPLAQVKWHAEAILAEVAAENSIVAITPRGRLAAVVLSAADYDELTELAQSVGVDSARRDDGARRARESDAVGRHLQHLAELVTSPPSR